MAQEVRDPLHGSIPVESGEWALIDDPAFQRLRHVRQLGFSELSFPGATHTRYLHSLGTMELATRAFDTLFSGWSFPDPSRGRELRQMVRLAALLHDLGHAPLSHATEFAMPPVAGLGLPGRTEGADGARQATHEDYTLKLVMDSQFTGTLEGQFPFPAAAVAGLIDIRLDVDPGLYQCGALNYRPVLSQIISSELDVDRMDYLARDSYFSGVQYGHFDLTWLLNNLSPHPEDGSVHLALDGRAIYTFDHFLLARYHMFLMVYFHYRSVAYEQLLRDFLEDGGDGYRVPINPDEYTQFDDAHLLAVLRASQHPQARRLVERRAYRVFLERHDSGQGDLLDEEAAGLQAASIPHHHVTSHGIMSKYMRPVFSAFDATQPIYVLWRDNSMPERIQPLSAATDLFKKYAGDRRISRIYVPAEDMDRAKATLWYSPK